MYTISYIESEEFFYLDVFLKLLLGLLALALIINKSGKGNLAPSSAMDQVQNYVLGGIIGGVTAHELAFKLRKEGVYYIREVKRAVLEQNGELIIVLAGEENPKYPVITDGIIQKSVLEDVDKTEEWLLGELQKAGYSNPSEVFLAEYENAQIKVIPYI